ncbi:MAG: hypothetical protein QOG85_2232 [Gaiellaceae bacterium]|nr:hypothetical protein [Gaiellaceae bacterium]
MCPVESAADRANLAHPDDWGVVAIYTPAGGGPTSSVAGNLFDEFDEVDTAAFVSVEGSRPRFELASSLVPLLAHGDTLLITRADYNPALVGKEYIIRSVQPDHTGHTKLVLEEVA